MKPTRIIKRGTLFLSLDKVKKVVYSHIIGLKKRKYRIKLKKITDQSEWRWVYNVA